MFLLACLLILVFSLIQSVFGFGLLAFGTPVFLLLGNSFQDTLLIVLPCSLAISTCQLFKGWEHLTHFKRDFPRYALLPLIIGLSIVLSMNEKYDLRLFVGCMLMLSAAVRYSSKASQLVRPVLEKYAAIYLALMGFIHGCTNMGGALLAIFVSNQCESKHAVRAHIAYAYTIFAVIQLGLVLVLSSAQPSYRMLLFPLISLATFFYVGNKVFHAASVVAYHHLMSIALGAFGISLVVAALL
ncbi:TSUP family transporter [Oligoflexia bacterium]|nr:TSUP family transporter [Oligoflexia bacterium]